ncbi:MAG: DNA glycosylase AlkZ-like family protein [Actinomycetes bacterium]
MAGGCGRGDRPRRGTGPTAQPRFVLAEHLEALEGGGSTARTVRLVGPYDPYLQLRDRELLVGGEAQRKDLWPVLGRPGAILGDGEVLGTWRPRASGRRLTVRIEPWGPMKPRDWQAVEEQAERLAAHRGVDLADVTED